MKLRIEDDKFYINNTYYKDADVEKIDHLYGENNEVYFGIRRAYFAWEVWRLSIIWGSGTYSDNYKCLTEDASCSEEVERAEIALWTDEIPMNVQGYVPAEKIMLLLTEMPFWPPDMEVPEVRDLV